MKQQAPDWPRIINDIVGTGMTLEAISKADGVSLSLRAIVYLRDITRGQQPIYHRGDYLLRLWSERTGNPRESVPMADIVRGHRKVRQAVDNSPKLQHLPPFPAPVQRTDMQGKGRRKVKEAA